MKVLIISGTRFLGPHIAQQVGETGHEVLVVHWGKTISQLPAGAKEVLVDEIAVPCSDQPT